MKISDTLTISQEIKLKARGIMRHTYGDFLPIMLKFKHSKDKAEQIDGKYKLVTYCQSSSINENYVLKEYLAYKLYNQVTPYSFKIRLAKINYIDLNNPDKAIPVVYDFDNSGFVGTNYLATAKGLSIEMVTERYYMGICTTQDVLTGVINEFSALQGQFIETIDNFYKTCKNPKTLIYNLNATCMQY